MSNRPQGGAAAAELVLATPALFLLMLLVVFLGRMTESRAQVDGAAMLRPEPHPSYVYQSTQSVPLRLSRHRPSLISASPAAT